MSFDDLNNGDDNTEIYHKTIQYANIVNAISNISANTYMNDVLSRKDIGNNEMGKLILMGIQEIVPINILKVSSNDQFDYYKIDSFFPSFINRGVDFQDLSRNRIPYFLVNDDDFKIFSSYLTKNLDLFLKNDELLQIILIMQESSIMAGKLNCDVSIVLSFFAIERIVNLMWLDLIKEKGRKNKLENSKEYTVSIKSNVLYFNNRINKEMLEKIDNARRIRNIIVHGKYVAFYKNKLSIADNFSDLFVLTGTIFGAAMQLMGSYYNVPFNMSFSSKL